MHLTVRLAGYGGYGIVTAGRILGVAFTHQGYHALQTESHGAAARGGACTADVTISDQPIHNLSFQTPNILVAHSLPSFKRYLQLPALKPETVVLEEELLAAPQVEEWLSETNRGVTSCYKLPARKIALQLGHVRYIGVASLGALTRIHPQITMQSLATAIRTDPKLKRYKNTNIKALQLGAKLTTSAIE